MKRMGFTVVVMLVLASLVAGAAAAGPTGGVTHTSFSVQYGPFACGGDRIVKSGPDGFIEDREVCIVSADILPDGTYDATQPPIGPWCSDFDGFSFCNQATSGTIKIVSLGPAQLWFITAYYAQP